MEKKNCFQVVHERVVRAAGYTGVKKEISVWDAVVHSRRAADQVLVVKLDSFLHNKMLNF